MGYDAFWFCIDGMFQEAYYQKKLVIYEIL